MKNKTPKPDSNKLPRPKMDPQTVIDAEIDPPNRHPTLGKYTGRLLNPDDFYPDSTDLLSNQHDID